MATRERRRVEDLLELPYRITLARYDDGWRARVEELEGCEATGATAQEAAGAVRTAMAGWIGAALAEGRPVPPPRAAAKHSGRVLVRMPPALHAQLAGLAERERTSMNALIVGVLGGAVGRREPGAPADPAAPTAAAPAADRPPSPPDRARLLSLALTANLVVVLVAAIVAVGLLVLAWQGV
jgi:predicted RNase H-like HicB family nuclease